jgi:hypothetical protein
MMPHGGRWRRGTDVVVPDVVMPDAPDIAGNEVQVQEEHPDCERGKPTSHL